MQTTETPASRESRYLISFTTHLMNPDPMIFLCALRASSTALRTGYVVNLNYYIWWMPISIHYDLLTERGNMFALT